MFQTELAITNTNLLHTNKIAYEDEKNEHWEI